MAANHVLRLHSQVALELNLQPYIRKYTSSNENFEYGYPYSNGLLQCCFKLKCCKQACKEDIRLIFLDFLFLNQAKRLMKQYFQLEQSGQSSLLAILTRIQ